MCGKHPLLRASQTMPRATFTFRYLLRTAIICFFLPRPIMSSALKTGTPWPMYGRNQYQTNYSPFRTNTSKAGVVQWSYSAGNVIHSTPSIDSDGILYMGSDQGTLHAIDTTTQTAKWTYTVPKTSGISLYYIQSTPTITDDGTVYFGCYDNYLYSLSTDSGTLQWRFKTGNLVYASPMIDNNGYIYFGSHDKSFYCLSSSGTQIWKFSTTGRIYSTAAFSYSTAALVYFVASSPDYQFYALYTATGTKKFTVTLGYDSQSMSSPTVDKSDTVYIGSNDGYLYRIYTDGTYKRLYKGSSYAIYGNPTLSKDRTTLFYGSYDKYIYAVTTGGSFKWKYQTKYYVQTSAVVDGDGLVIIGSISGDAYALHPDTGSVVWKFTNSLGLNSASIGADGTVYFSSYDYKLYAVGGGYSSCGSGEGLGSNFNSTTTSLDDACSACDAGTYSSDSYCVDCSEGYFQDSQGSSNCTACPAGYISASTGASNCSACSAGKYSSSEGSSSCTMCPKGQYTSVSGSSICTVCAAGSYSSSVGATSCSLCSVGMYISTNGSSSCTGCPRGTYTNSLGSSSCTLCPTGRYAPNTNSTSCELCSAGHYTDREGASSCRPCPEGTFSGVGESQCTACTWPMYNDGKGHRNCPNYRMLPYLKNVQIKTAVTIFLFSISLFAMGILCVQPYASPRPTGIIVTRVGVALFLLLPYIDSVSSLMYLIIITFNSAGVFALMWIIIVLGPFLTYVSVLHRLLKQPQCKQTWWAFPATAVWFLVGCVLMETRLLFVSPIWNTWSRLYTGTRDYETDEKGLHTKYFNKADFASGPLITLPLLVLQAVNSNQTDHWGYIPILSLFFGSWTIAGWLYRYNPVCFEHLPITNISVQVYVMQYKVLDLVGDGRLDNVAVAAAAHSDDFADQNAAPIVLMRTGEMLHQADVHYVYDDNVSDVSNTITIQLDALPDGSLFQAEDIESIPEVANPVDRNIGIVPARSTTTVPRSAVGGAALNSGTAVRREGRQVAARVAPHQTDDHQQATSGIATPSVGSCSPARQPRQQGSEAPSPDRGHQPIQQSRDNETAGEAEIEMSSASSPMSSALDRDHDTSTRL